MTERIEKPWWWPVLCDRAYFTRLREDYPDDADCSDEELHETYADGQKYATTWDHTGDAYEEYEKLADAFLALQDVAKAADVKIHGTVDDSEDGTFLLISDEAGKNLAAAIQAAKKIGAME
jgi:hypothetical protein